MCLLVLLSIFSRCSIVSSVSAVIKFILKKLLKFVFQLIYKHRIDMTDMLVTYYGKAILN